MNMLILFGEGTIKTIRKTHIENIKPLEKRETLRGKAPVRKPKKWKHTPNKTHWTKTYFETLGWNPYIPKTSGFFSNVLLFSVLFKMVCFFPMFFGCSNVFSQCFLWLVSMCFFHLFFIVCFCFFFKFCSPQDLCFVFFCVCLQLL